MKLNSEKILAFLALCVLIVGFTRIGAGLLAPTRGIRVVSYSIPRTAREVLPRSYRKFAPEDAPGRNPFSFSEGWERLDTIPLEPPPLPRAPHPLPALAAGPDPRGAGLRFERPLDASEVKADGGEEEGS